MNYDELAEVVNKFYNNTKLTNVKLQDLTKKRSNNARAKELMSIRVEFKHVHMSGKENLDIMLKKAYLYDFPTVSKEQLHMEEITDLNKSICFLDTQITKLSVIDVSNPAIDKKRQEQKILQTQYDKLIEMQPKDDNINLNGIAMKILKILEKDDEESRKIHNVIKFKVCGTTTADDMAIRKNNLKYLTGETRAEEEKKIEQIESNINSRSRGIRSYHSTVQLSSGYVMPHLRPKHQNGALSTNDISKIAEKMENENEEYPDLKTTYNLKKSKSEIYPALSTQKEQKTTELVGVWGAKKSIASVIKENTHVETKINEHEKVFQILSTTIEVVHDSVEKNKPQKDVEKENSKNMEVDDWLIEC